MRQPLPTLVTLSATASLLLGGCDQQASHSAAQRELETAMLKIDAAERGYVTDPANSPDAWAYRDQALDAAAAPLRNALDSGSPEQKTVAARQLAMIELAGARHQSRQALASYAEVASQSASLLRYVTAVARADARTESLSVDDQSSIDDLTAEIDKTRETIAQRQAEADELQAQIDDHQAQADEAMAQAGSARVQASEYETQAFVAEGDGRFDILDAAAEADRSGQVASTEADRQSAKVEQLSRKLAIAQTAIDSGKAAVEELNQRIASIHDQNAAVTEERQVAEGQLVQVGEQLAEAFRAVDQRYQDEVDAPMDNAQQRANNAVDLLAQAKSTARGMEANAVLGDQLTALSDRAYLLIEHAAAADAYAQTLGVVAGVADRLPVEAADQLRQAREQAMTKRDQMVEKANEVIAEAKSIADGLQDDAAITQADQLAAYQRQLESFN